MRINNIKISLVLSIISLFFTFSCLKNNKPILHLDTSFERELAKNKSILSIKPFSSSLKNYESMPQAMKFHYKDSHRYEKIRARIIKKYKNRFFEITYLSNNHKVKGVVVLPREFDHSKKYPILIYNRGGNREFGRIYNPTGLLEKLTNNRYILFASQYSGVAGGEGKDEFGGSDIFDVLKILNLSKEYPFVDPNNVFMLGWSRGGMMTYLALKHGAKVNAAISIAGPSDLFLNATRRPKMDQVFGETIPNYRINKNQELKKRSATFWPEKINTPTLIIHGDEDIRVDISNSQKLAKLLKNHNKPHKLVTFKNEGHSLEDVMPRVYEEIENWLDRYSK